MGCWNETCMISNLPVTHGTEVAMTILTKSDGEWYKPNSLFYLSPIMFYGEYDDYGSSENTSDGIGLQFTVDEYQAHKTKFDDKLSADEIVTKIAREELIFHDVKTFKAGLMGMADEDKISRLGFIRKDVLDRILEDYSWETTFYDKTKDEEFIYHTINFQYYLDCIPDAIKTFKAHYEKYSGSPAMASMLSFSPVPDSDMHDSNMLIKWVHAHSKESTQHPFHKSIGTKIQELAEANLDEELTEFLTEFSKYCVLFKFMMDSRKVFTPQPNTSQDCDTDTHRLFSKIVTDIAEEVEKQYNDDWDERWDPVRKVAIEQVEMQF